MASKASLFDLSREPIDTSEDLEAYFQDIKTEGDRAAVLISSSAIEHMVTQLIRTKLIELTKPEDDDLFYKAKSTLGTFASRIDIAYALGLIDKSQCADLDRIRRIRNAFAHSVKRIELPTKVVAEECDKLTNYKNPNPDGKKITTPRDKYMETIHTLYIDLLRKYGAWQSRILAAQRRKVRKLKRELGS